jgi:hypothetical protein
MDQLPHAPVGIAILFRGDALGKAVDEDGAQGLVLAMVGGGIGVQEEPLASVGVHGRTLECELVLRGISHRKWYQKGRPGPTDGCFQARKQGRSKTVDRSREGMTTPCPRRIGSHQRGQKTGNKAF